jgi:hypothetical protein
MRGGRPLARGRAGAAPERLILHFDTTPIDVHSEKEQADGYYKRGFQPLLVSCVRGAGRDPQAGQRGRKQR